MVYNRKIIGFKFSDVSLSVLAVCGQEKAVYLSGIGRLVGNRYIKFLYHEEQVGLPYLKRTAVYDPYVIPVLLKIFIESECRGKCIGIWIIVALYGDIVEPVKIF